MRLQGRAKLGPMANHHFGKLADVWKHLVPAEVLAADRPERLYDTHAGHALHATTTDPEPMCGALVAYIGGLVVGFGSLGPSRAAGVSDGTGEVPAIYVEPSSLGTGVGRELFEGVTRALRDAGYARATLWVLDTNERARGFYTAAGWHPDGATKTEERPGGTLHEVRYARNLRSIRTVE